LVWRISGLLGDKKLAIHDAAHGVETDVGLGWKDICRAIAFLATGIGEDDSDCQQEK
jgi:hypothetical protein